jgi:hypothetical protein
MIVLLRDVFHIGLVIGPRPCCIGPFLISQHMKRWKNTKNIGKHFIPDIVEAGA